MRYLRNHSGLFREAHLFIVDVCCRHPDELQKGETIRGTIMLVLRKNKDQQLTVTVASADAAAVSVLLRLNDIEFGVRGRIVLAPSVKFTLDTLPRITAGGYWAVTTSTELVSEYTHLFHHIGDGIGYISTDGVTEEYGMCDDCGGMSRFDYFYHFSSMENKHIHICEECVVKPKYTTRLVI